MIIIRPLLSANTNDMVHFIISYNQLQETFLKKLCFLWLLNIFEVTHGELLFCIWNKVLTLKEKKNWIFKRIKSEKCYLASQKYTYVYTACPGSPWPTFIFETVGSRRMLAIGKVFEFRYGVKMLKVWSKKII